MTRYEQIEEMAKIMFGHICSRVKCDSCKYPNKQKDCEAYRNAEALYNAGYRKSDEIQLECENASLTVENEVLKRDVQNLERTLEEGREAIENLKADKNILLIELEDAERKIKEYKSGETITLTKTEYERLEKAEMEAVLSSYHLRENVRNETAKEIFGILLECSEMVETDGQEFPFIYTENIFSLAKQYGVEVDE